MFHFSVDKSSNKMKCFVLKTVILIGKKPNSWQLFHCIILWFFVYNLKEYPTSVLLTSSFFCLKEYFIFYQLQSYIYLNTYEINNNLLVRNENWKTLKYKIFFSETFFYNWNVWNCYYSINSWKYNINLNIRSHVPTLTILLLIMFSW